MLLTRHMGAESNAGPGEFAAQVEDCDWGNAGCRCGGDGGSVLAAGRVGGLAAAAIEPVGGGIDKEKTRRGNAGRQGEKDVAGRGSSSRGVQRTLCTTA